MKEILKYLWERRTTTLGYIGIVASVWAAADVFDAGTVKVLLLVNATVTAVLGHYNNHQVKKEEQDE